MMKRILTSIGLAAAVSAAAVTAHAAGVLYDCDITERDPAVDWIAEKYVFVVAEDGSVSVVDDVLLTFNEGPLIARARMRGDSMRLNWTIRSRDSTGNQANMSYRAQLDTQEKVVIVRGKAVGYPQGWVGAGRCKTREE